MRARSGSDYVNNHFADVCSLEGKKGREKDLYFGFNCGTNITKCQDGDGRVE